MQFLRKIQRQKLNVCVTSTIDMAWHGHGHVVSDQRRLLSNSVHYWH